MFDTHTALYNCVRDAGSSTSDQRWNWSCRSVIQRRGWALHVLCHTSLHLYIWLMFCSLSQTYLYSPLLGLLVILLVALYMWLQDFGRGILFIYDFLLASSCSSIISVFFSFPSITLLVVLGYRFSCLVVDYSWRHHA